jgi:hypothetical protein
LNLDYTDQETYDSLYHNVKRQLDIFADSAAYVYGHRPESVGQLRTKLQNNKTRATIYYETVLPAKQAVNDVLDAGKSFIEEIINY